MAIQSIYFFAFYFVLDSLSIKRLETIALSAMKSLMIFVTLHFFSPLFFAGGSPASLFANTANFWNIYVIYQSHLTYPLVLTMGLWMMEYNKSFFILTFILLTFFKRVNYSIQPIILLCAFIFIDWNVNANLYQPYYAGIFSLSLLMISSRFRIKINAKSSSIY